jgi:hypothetical protein
MTSARNVFNVSPFRNDSDVGIESRKFLERQTILRRDFDLLDQFLKLRLEAFSNSFRDQRLIRGILEIDHNVNFLLETHFHDKKILRNKKKIYNRQIEFLRLLIPQNSGEMNLESGVKINNIR